MTMIKDVRVVLNGNEVFGYKGQRILDLCSDNGIEIPTFCYNEHLTPHGGCSVCLVEVEGAKALVRACVNNIAPDMVVKTDSPRAFNARKLALELLLSDHVGDCRPPCTLHCPARANVQGYVNTAAQGKFRESLDILHENIVLPASIGRVCTAPCQENCRRRFVEEPVSIRNIKRFVGDRAIAEGDLGAVPAIRENGHKVAVVGGGAAGLSAAYYLRLEGYGVTIYDKEPLLGGMMRYGIPDYRLPPHVLQAEIDWLLSHGIQLKASCELGKDVSLDELRAGYDAVLLAMGCWKSSPLRCEGEDLEGVLGGIDFLYTVNSHDPIKLGERVAVIGGGNTAMDACRCAVRLGVKEVTVIYRRTEAEMPAEDIEIVEAREEGVNFRFLLAPARIEGDGKVERIVCEEMELGEPDASGRRSPVATGRFVTIPVDNVIAAVGQQIDFKGLPQETNNGKRMNVNEDYETPLKGVFVCGDQQTGPKIAVEALGTGHWAAKSIDHFIKNGVAKAPFVYDVVRDDLTEEDFLDKERIPREFPAHVEPEVRLSKPFDEYDRGLTEEQVVKDSNRCMECGCPDVYECKLRRYAIDYEVNPERVEGEHVSCVQQVNKYFVRTMDKCILCGQCVRTCDEIAGPHAIDFSKRGFDTSVDPEYFHSMEDSKCNFCGLCVQNCPTGALTEIHAPRLPYQEKPVIASTTCQYCAVGCQLEMNLDKAKSRIVRITTDLNSKATGGMSCLYGRFYFQSVQHYRVETPYMGNFPIEWKGAANELGNLMAGNGAIIADGSLLNEELAALGKMAKDFNCKLAVVGNDNFKAARTAMLNRWATDGAGSYDDLRDADCIVVLGGDVETEHPVLFSWIRQKMRKGTAKVVACGENGASFDVGHVIAVEGEPVEVARDIIAGGSSKARMSEAMKALKGAKKVAVLADYSVCRHVDVVDGLLSILDAKGSKGFYPLYLCSNTLGALRLGLDNASVEEIVAGARAGKISTVFLAGDMAVNLIDVIKGSGGCSACSCADGPKVAVATSNMFEGQCKTILTLPLKSWAEKKGSMVVMTGETYEVAQGPVAPDNARDMVELVGMLKGAGLSK